MDRTAFLLANRLVGNPDAAAALECMLGGPRLEMRTAAVLAVTGAEMPATLNGQEIPRWTTVGVRAGDVLRLRPTRRGVSAYIAFAGVLDVPSVLGSRATYLRGMLGGFRGRALKNGDVLPLGPAAAPREGALGRRVRPEMIPSYGEEVEIRVVLGPQADRFTPEGIARFLGEPYEMTHQVDRMGARLQGPAITHTRGHDIVSDGIPLGGIQVIGEGQPIVLLVDRQSAGGYTKVATVCSFDIGRVAQAGPGQRLRFKSLTVPEAHALLKQERARLETALA
jgi:biotin-dependent carboxylase-like uncharacterized protein